MIGVDSLVKPFHFERNARLERHCHPQKSKVCTWYAIIIKFMPCLTCVGTHNSIPNADAKTNVISSNAFQMSSP